MVKKLLSWILLGALLLSLSAPVHAAPRVVLLEGIDVSYAQGKIDWDTAAEHVDFVIIRCGFGQDRTEQDDEQWVRNADACTRLGIPFGVYLYSYATTDAAARSEAAHVLRLVKNYQIAFPIFLDVEDVTIQSKCSKEDILRHVTIFCEIIADAGYTPGVYSNANFWKDYMPSPEYSKWERWVAQWNNPVHESRPYCAWQYTSEGKIPGIDGYVDRDYWYGFQTKQECSHSYTSAIAKAPTCTEPGTKRYTCSMCNHSYDESIPAKGHNITTTKIPPTCATEGSIVSICSSCGYASTETIPPRGHNVTESIIPATCAADGSRTFTCITCGFVYQEKIPAKGHTVTETTVPPTCNTSGSKIFTCTTCGYVYQEEIPATGHVVTETIVPPTCTAPGNKILICTTCGYVYQEAIPAKGHTLSNHLIPPTCTENGVNRVTCSVCNYSYDESLPAKGHDLSNFLIPPTCTENGVNKAACANCDYSYDEILPAKGHQFTETVVPPTDGQAGYTIFTCHCGYSYVSDEIYCPKHVSDNGTITKAPTETECGEKVYHCVTCGSLLETEILPPTGNHASQCPSAAFTDVPALSHWAHKGIDFCVKEGLFRGVSETRFDPDGIMTRAMLVTVLWRFEGCPAASTPCDFADVEPGSWYADAVAWAQESAIVKGVGQNYFDPMGEVTREQFATILYRRKANASEPTVPESTLYTFPDACSVSDYAKLPFAWAVQKGYINGTYINGNVYLDPQGFVTRAQAATIIQRLAQQ